MRSSSFLKSSRSGFSFLSAKRLLGAAVVGASVFAAVVVVGCTVVVVGSVVVVVASVVVVGVVVVVAEMM